MSISLYWESDFLNSDILKVWIKEANTHFDSSVKLNDNSGRVVTQLEYASAIYSMMYAMYCTRPDLLLQCVDFLDTLVILV
jgi:hypothetical protein